PPLRRPAVPPKDLDLTSSIADRGRLYALYTWNVTGYDYLLLTFDGASGALIGRTLTGPVIGDPCSRRDVICSVSSLVGSSGGVLVLVTYGVPVGHYDFVTLVSGLTDGAAFAPDS